MHPIWLKTTALAALFVMAVSGGAFAAKETDEKESSDHPLFTRMPGTYIDNYKVVEFDQVKFRLKDGKQEAVEGKVTKISYKMKKGQSKPSAVEIIRNHTNSIEAIGGQTLFADNRDASMRLSKDGKDVWARVSAAGGQYSLTIVERQAMAQSVSSDAIFDALTKDGFMVIDVHFETGKAVITPDSKPLIDQIIAMLKKNTGLKVSVDGHTDNVGDPKSNKSLSEARAKAVMDAVSAGGVDAGRMKAVGWGETKPVADNRTEEGRAKNRRVELVKM
jgi:outer membrane protein OmpA-like peptidoglycan-associated protein